MSAKKKEDVNPCIPPEPEYVIVAEREDEESERIELPTSSEDNTLGLQTLTRAFPNAHGLKFKNPVTKAFRALLTDSSGSKFFAPAGGWQDKTFLVIYQSQSTSDNVGGSAGAKKSSIKSDQNAKRRKIMRDSDDDGKDSSDSDTAMTTADKRQRQNGGAFKQKRLNDDGDENESSTTTDLIVLGLPFKLNELEVKEYFEQFGKVALVEVKKKSTGVSKGFGFVRMDTFEGQLKVLNKPTHLIGNRKCQVRVPLDKNGEVRENPLASAKIFVGRLQEKTTAAELKQFFADEAQKIDSNTSVLDVYIPKPFRAFAFITFSNPMIVKKLLKRTDFVIDGSSVSISSAMPKNTTPNNNSNIPPHMSNAIPQFNRTSNAFPEHDHGFNGWFESSAARYNREPPYPPPNRNRLSGQPFVGSNYPMGGGVGQCQPSGSGASGSQLASGLETLNLNSMINMKPEVVNAWKAFISVAQSNGAMSPPQHSSSPPQHHYGGNLPPQYQQQQQMHPRHNGGQSQNPGQPRGQPSAWR